MLEQAKRGHLVIAVPKTAPEPQVTGHPLVRIKGKGEMGNTAPPEQASGVPVPALAAGVPPPLGVIGRPIGTQLKTNNRSVARKIKLKINNLSAIKPRKAPAAGRRDDRLGPPPPLELFECVQ